MKRLVHTVAALLALAGTAVMAVPAAHAGPLVLHTFSGTLTDTYSGKPLVGATIEATAANAAVVASVVTGPLGVFSVQSAEATLGFRVVSAKSHQSGYRLCEFNTAWESGPSCQLGFAAPIPIDTMPDFVAGDVVDSITGLPIKGVTVRAVGTDGVTPFGQALTDVNGHYVVHGVVGEEVGIFVNGLAVGHRAGYFSCLKTLVRTWGEACTYSAGFRMTHVIAPLLSVPQNVVMSPRIGKVALTFTRPAAGVAIGYDLRCIGPDAVVRVVPVLASGVKVGPFPAGANKCRLRARSVWGPGPYSAAVVVNVL